MELLAQGGNSLICVQRTGWGKSAVYFLATHLVRSRGGGPTIIISPLLALMRNQVAAAERLGIYAATVNSSNKDEWDEILGDLEKDSVDVLLIAPERFGNKEFQEHAGQVLGSAGLLVIDEAHCISDWGHDFRPDYRRLGSVIAQLSDSASILCTTATANDRVVADVHDQLAASTRPISEIRGPLERESLRLEVIDLPSQAQKLAWVASNIEELEGSGIVYCATVRDTELVCSWLLHNGITTALYHARMDDDERLAIEERLVANEIKALVATSALGMGYDKPDLGFVVHFHCPGSPVAYYQQVGRAGRALQQADGIVLRGEEDFHIQEYFIEASIPPRQRVEELQEAFAQTDGEEVSIRELESRMPLGRRRIENMLKILEVEGVVKRTAYGIWTLGSEEWTYDDARFEELTRVRNRELNLMRDYGTDGMCLMEFLRRELDDQDAAPCGRCAICTSSRFASPLDQEVLARAARFIRNQHYEIKPRKQWAGPRRRSGVTIKRERRAEAGIALSKYADGAYGDLVRDGKYRDGSFSNELLEAAVDRLTEWNPEPLIAWVTAVPSLNHPELVPLFARNLAERLGLPFIPAISKARPRRPQKAMENSNRQAANVFEAFSVDQAEVRPGPVLVVDDMCDSRWTMTEIAFLLRDAGSGPVFPFALADSSNQ